jgi:hypothetical protein
MRRSGAMRMWYSDRAFGTVPQHLARTEEIFNTLVFLLISF